MQVSGLKFKGDEQAKKHKKKHKREHAEHADEGELRYGATRATAIISCIFRIDSLDPPQACSG